MAPYGFPFHPLSSPFLSPVCLACDKPLECRLDLFSKFILRSTKQDSVSSAHAKGLHMRRKRKVLVLNTMFDRGYHLSGGQHFFLILPRPLSFLLVDVLLPQSTSPLWWHENLCTVGSNSTIPWEIHLDLRPFQRRLSQWACEPGNICFHEYLMGMCHPSQMPALEDAPTVITITVI